MHEPDPERRGGVEPLAGDEVAPGRARADLRQRERRDHGRDDSQLDLGEGEDGALVRHGDVGARDEAGTAAERMTLHACDHRRRAPVDRLEHAAERVRVGDIGLQVEVDRGPHPLHVGAGTEARAVSREHDGAGLADVDERLCELRDQGGVEGVSRLRPGERDPQQVAVAFDPQRTHPPSLRGRIPSAS